MYKKMDWELILNYLEGNISQEQENKINEWLQSSKKNRQSFQLLKNIWNTPEASFPKSDTEAAWLAVKKRIKTEQSKQNLPSANIFPLKPKEKSRPVFQLVFGSKLLRVAAVLMVASFFFYHFLKPAKPISEQEIHVENTKLKIITLADGSKVTLDGGSTFRYSDTFNKNIREVFLNGEGFFEVTSNPGIPFKVHSNGALITVLGTKFNVRAWQSNKRVVVAVAEGNVSLQPENVKEPNASVVIRENQMSELKENNYPSPPKHVEINEYLSWQHKEMYFKGVPLYEVLDQIERWYDLDISLSDTGLASNRVTIFIQDKPVEEILELIALINECRYEQNGKKIIFSPKQ